MSEASLQLEQAHQLIKQGSKKEARDIIMAVLQTERDNANAWVLLAFTITDPDKRNKAFHKALKLDPNNRTAKAALAKFDPPPTTSIIDIDDDELPTPKPAKAKQKATKSGGGRRRLLRVSLLLIILIGGGAAALLIPASPLYYVRLMGGGGVIYVEPSTIDRGEITLGQTISGEIDPDANFVYDGYTFQGTAGQGVRFIVTDTDTSQTGSEPELKLYLDGAEDWLDTADFMETQGYTQLEMALPQDGTYRVEVSSFWGGTYELTAEEAPTVRLDDNGTPIDDRGELLMNESVSGTLQDGVDDVYVVTVDETQGVLFQVSTTDMMSSPEVRLYDAAGQLVAEGRLRPGPEEVATVQTLVQAGTYELHVYDHGSAVYDLVMVPDDILMVDGIQYADMGSITVGGTVDGIFNTSDDIPHGYTITGSGTVIVTANAQDQWLDPQLKIFAPDGTLVAENEDITFIENQNAQTAFRMDGDGEYLIMVMMQSIFEGPYQLTVEE